MMTFSRHLAVHEGFFTVLSRALVRTLASLAIVLGLTAATAAADTAELDALNKFAEQSDTVWNERDAAALADLYAPDASLVIATRDVNLEGRDAIRDYFTLSFARVPTDFRHLTKPVKVTHLGDDYVLVDNAVTLYREADGPEKPVTRFFTLTLLLRNDGAYSMQAVRAVPLG